jgi:septal ring factor EnvC (AmiA/AmiB activator)
MDEIMQNIDKNCKDIQAQIDVYKQNSAIKEMEQKELLKCLKEYKSKYTEFDKATKKSSKNLQTIKKNAGILAKEI